LRRRPRRPLPQLQSQILDPNAVGSPVGNWSPPHPLPRRVRAFGFVPDESRLRPGDLLLVSATNPSRGSNAIIRAQTAGGHHRNDASWHHAAVYIGEALICEAQLWSGVRVTSLYDYVGTHRLRFRRDLTITADDGWRIALRTLESLHRRYSLSALPRLWAQSIKGFWRPEVRHRDVRAVVCSEIFGRAYSLTTGRMLVPGSLNIITPADLSLCASLTDVPDGWLRIVEVAP
jgi:hypothetical protein